MVPFSLLQQVLYDDIIYIKYNIIHANLETRKSELEAEIRIEAVHHYWVSK